MQWAAEGVAKLVVTKVELVEAVVVEAVDTKAAVETAKAAIAATGVGKEGRADAQAKAMEGEAAVALKANRR